MATLFSYNDSGITFDRVKRPGLIVSTGPISTHDYKKSSEVGKPSFNSIDIDWNNAKLGETIVSTTGQLLSYLSTISEKISNLENILINL